MLNKPHHLTGMNSLQRGRENSFPCAEPPPASQCSFGITVLPGQGWLVQRHRKVQRKVQSTVGKRAALIFPLSLLSLLGLKKYKFGIPHLCPITSDCLLFPRKKGEWGRQPAWESLRNKAEIPSHSPGQTATGKKEKPQEMKILSSPALSPHAIGLGVHKALQWR